MIKKKHLLILLFFVQMGFAQNAILSNDSKVSVLTCGSGSELYAAFGHTAIRIQDPSQGLDVVYNYGTFDFRTEHFYLKFIKGDLNYFVSASHFNDFIAEYQYDQRSVVEQTLALKTSQKQKLFDQLNTSLYADEKYYTYKFIDQNCTTMVADKLVSTLTNGPIQKVDTDKISYREVLYPYFENHYWFKLGINIIFGAPTDVAATQLFLPIELQHSLDKYVIQQHAVVEKTVTLVEGNPENAAFSFWNSGYFFTLLLVMIGISRSRKVYSSYLFLLGGIGLFFAFAGLYSFHKEITWNYHILLFNPLFVAIPWIAKTVHFKKTIVFISCGLLLFTVYVATLPHVLLVAPIIVLNSWVLWFYYKNTIKE
jgi:Domain of unknown function (DUF4105)